MGYNLTPEQRSRLDDFQRRAGITGGTSETPINTIPQRDTSKLNSLTHTVPTTIDDAVEQPIPETDVLPQKSDYVVILVRAPYSNAKDGEFKPYKLGLRVKSVERSGGSVNELTALIHSLSEHSGIPIESETPGIELLTSKNLTNLLHNLSYNSNASLAGVYDGFAQLKVPAGHAVHILPKRDLRTYLTETPLPTNNQ